MGTDLLPPILDILNIPAPSDRVLDGKNLLPLLEQGGESPHEYLYYLSGEPFGVRDARYKYMRKRGVGYLWRGANLDLLSRAAPGCLIS
jgi:hypothetical protein